MAWSGEVNTNSEQPKAWANPNYRSNQKAIPPPERERARDEESPLLKQMRMDQEFKDECAKAKIRLTKSRKARAKLRDLYATGELDEELDALENKLDTPVNRLIRREILRVAIVEPNRLDNIIDMLFTLAEAGDKQAAREIFNRIDGAVTQQVELRNPQGDKPGELQPLEIRITGLAPDNTKWE